MQVTGICSVKVNGKLLRTKEGAKLKLGGMERTPIMANGRVAGYAEKAVPAELEATLAHAADTDVLEIGGWVDATLIFETDTNKKYLVKNAFTTETLELTAGEGDLSLKMAGEAAEEA